MAISLIKYSFEIGAITEEQREKAERYKKETGASDETVIKDMKLLSDEKLIQIYSKIYGYKAELEPEVSDFTLATQFKKRDLQRLGFFPANSENAIVLYTSEPSELLFVEDFVRDKTGYRSRFSYVITTDAAIHKLIDSVFREETSVDADEFGISGDNMTSNVVYDIAENDSSAIVNWVNKIFRDAVENRISDIHFEPQEDAFYVRYRSDGSLKIEHKLPMSTARQIINRIKTMSNLDVNTSKSIQDGNCRLDIFGKFVDLRVSVIPAVNGENLVVRVLDQNKMSLDVSMIGFTKENEKKFLKIIEKPKVKVEEPMPWDSLALSTELANSCSDAIKLLTANTVPGWKLGDINCKVSGVSTTWMLEWGRIANLKTALKVYDIKNLHFSVSEDGKTAAGTMPFNNIKKIPSPPTLTANDAMTELTDIFQALNLAVTLSITNVQTEPTQKNALPVHLYSFVSFAFSSELPPTDWESFFNSFASLEITDIMYNPESNVWRYEGRIYGKK